jgi:hypothetical protein
MSHTDLMQERKLLNNSGHGAIEKLQQNESQNHEKTVRLT